jgi:hypothetical protein
MDERLSAVELTGMIDKHQRLKLDEPLPISGPRRVRVILLYTTEAELNTEESEWLRAAASNPAFDFLKDPEEDIYTRSDGALISESIQE